MGNSSEKGDHPVTKNIEKDSTNASRQSLDAMKTKEAQNVLQATGSNADMSSFPSVDRLLQQFDRNVQQEKQEQQELAKDDKQMAEMFKVGQPALDSHNQRERDYLKSLQPNELKDIGDFTKALESGNFDQAEKVVQRYTEHPGRFQHMINEPIHLEMQRLGLDKKYDLEFYNN
ncbi:MAG: hypothetical protein K2Y22_05445 [Candidatus Obscuribacterales bacterium]|nr:hypothetical protein [Candidatus Obscuribacterales bacterium]